MINIDPVPAIIKKEIFSWFFSPLFYGLCLFFALFLPIRLFYFQAFFAVDSADLSAFFTGFPLAFILAVPAVTMKSWTEERKTSAAELLFSMPVTEWKLCIAKFFSSFIILLLMIILSAPVILSLLPLAKFDAGVIAAQYSGVILLAAFAAGLGLFCSAVSKNQAAAFLSCAAVLLALVFVDRITVTIILPAPVVSFINFISLSARYRNFSRGLLDSRDLVFLIAGTVFFIFLNTRQLILSRRIK
ncbi:MAG: ABC transporter permease [Treponema sp.]|nr:ABC transporter permease [Treponema sp.]